MILKGMNCDAFLMQDCYRIYLDDILKTKILKKGRKKKNKLFICMTKSSSSYYSSWKLDYFYWKCTEERRETRLFLLEK